MTSSLIPATIASHRVAGDRKIWFQPALKSLAKVCCIVLDAELYLERVRAVEIVERLQQDNDLPPIACAYVSSLDAAARHRDYTCSEDYASFLAYDVVPWIERSHGHFARYYLVGLSLSGLAAAFTVWKHPTLFAGALCQSPSAWWNQEWLVSAISGKVPGRFWLSVGNEELQTDVKHPPTSLHQVVSQLVSVRRLSERLLAAGASVRHHEYSGGHDPACWAAELPEALQWLLVTDM